MELQEQITALQSEKDHLVKTIQGIDAEKLALDQMYVTSIKEILLLKKEIIIKNESMNKLNIQIQTLLKEKEVAEEKIKILSERAIEV